MPKRHILGIHVWTENFLGSKEKGTELLALLERLDGGRWLPSKWGHFEPIRQTYGPLAYDDILKCWTEERPTGSGRISNTLFFRRTKPSALIAATAWRGRVPDLNHIWLDLDAAAFADADATPRLETIVRALIDLTQGVYATAWHSRQAHARIAQKTPLERLQRMDWMSYFGQPYMYLFGGVERILHAPCHSVKQVEAGVLMVATPRPDSPELTESDELLVSLEDYLCPAAFAGRGFPDVPCKVPEFSLAETVLPDPDTMQ